MLSTSPHTPSRHHLRPDEENYIAALTLGRTMAFLLYSAPVAALGIAVLVHPSVTRLPLETEHLVQLTTLIIVIAAELSLLWSVVHGHLPGTTAAMTQPLSEEQIALACNALSIGLWLFMGMDPRTRLVRIGINAALTLSVLVYFITKSLLSREPRWAVLSVLALPAAQAYTNWHSSSFVPFP